MGTHSVFKKVVMAFILAMVTLVFVGCKNDNITVVVKGYDGALLANAKVSVDDKSQVTNNEGVAKLSVSVPANESSKKSRDVVVKVSQKGFVNQSVVVKVVSNSANAQVTLQPVKQVIEISAIEQAQTIVGETLGAKVTLPANALVKPNGQLASGAVTMNLTPWDVKSSELRAMLGNGQALDGQNKRVTLISAGMMSVDFYDAAGNHLQLGSNASANIEMDLTQESVNKQSLTVGSTIPLWHFDEARGLWIEEGVGTVIASASSPTGMALSATVKHFSTWNWDLKFNNAGSVNVKCQMADGTATECSVVADVTLLDGSHFTNAGYIPATGLTVINMPSEGSISWTGSTTDGYIGTQSSGMSGNVIITLAPPKTKNLVKCEVNGAAVPCKVTLDHPTDDDLNFTLPAEGATIATSINNVTTLSWAGRSNNVVEDGKIVYYTGNIVAGISGAVTINLNNRIEIGTAARAVRIKCLNDVNTTVANCDIRVYNWSQEAPMLGEYTNIPVGSEVVFNIPNGVDINDTIAFTAANSTTQNDYYGESASKYIRYNELIDNQLIELLLGYRDWVQVQ